MSLPTMVCKKVLAYGVCWYIMMYMNTKTRTNIYLTDEQRQALAKLSEQTGAPVAEIVRRAIDFYLEKQREKDRSDKTKKQE